MTVSSTFFLLLIAHNALLDVLPAKEETLAFVRAVSLVCICKQTLVHVNHAEQTANNALQPLPALSALMTTSCKADRATLFYPTLAVSKVVTLVLRATVDII